jgi:hypothetical protein
MLYPCKPAIVSVACSRLSSALESFRHAQNVTSSMGSLRRSSSIAASLVFLVVSLRNALFDRFASITSEGIFAYRVYIKDDT